MPKVKRVVTITFPITNNNIFCPSSGVKQSHVNYPKSKVTCHLSPTPPMFAPKPKPSQMEISELPDGPSSSTHVKLDPQPHVREVSPPPPKSVNQKGPAVYYPPEFTKSPETKSVQASEFCLKP